MFKYERYKCRIGVRRDQNVTAITRPRVICIDIVRTIGIDCYKIQNCNQGIHPLKCLQHSY